MILELDWAGDKPILRVAYWQPFVLAGKTERTITLD